MARIYDTIVIGGGHNGLICAAYLARAGRSVLVLERRPILGGSAVSEEIHNGFKYPVLSHAVSLLRPQIIRDLELARFGLSLIPLDSMFVPFPDGGSLLCCADAERTRREIAHFSPRDAEAYFEFLRAMARTARELRPLFDAPAPNPATLDPPELLDTFRAAVRLLGLGQDQTVRILKLATMSAADWLAEWFESEEVKAPLSIEGITGSLLGVRSPGTAYVLLHNYMGEVDGEPHRRALPRGGTGALSEACAAAARSFGAVIRTGASVKRILVNRHGRVHGVVLDTGEELQAKSVASGLEPRRTFLDLVGEDALDEDFAGRIKRYKLAGAAGKVNLAVDRVPEFSSRPGDGPHLRGEIIVAPSTDYLEKAYDDAKYGGFSKKPCLRIIVPSLSDPTVAPPGKHVVSILAQYAPYRINGGPASWEDKREAFGDAVIDALAEYWPSLRDSILHRQVISPWDLEKEYGLSEGNLHHGELRLEQIAFQRPVAKWAHYRTPIEDLYLCGAGAHPGGGIMGTPGQLAAREILSSGAV